MRILITDGIEASAEQALLERGHEVVRKFYPPEELGGQLERFDALIVRSATKVRQPAIDRAAAAGRLRVICRGGVGMDNIDVDYVRSKGLAVRNTPGTSTNSVAEMTLGLMLSAMRHIGPATASMRQGQWNKKQYTGIELGGKRWESPVSAESAAARPRWPEPSGCGCLPSTALSAGKAGRLPSMSISTPCWRSPTSSACIFPPLPEGARW